MSKNKVNSIFVNTVKKIWKFSKYEVKTISESKPIKNDDEKYVFLNISTIPNYIYVLTREPTRTMDSRTGKFVSGYRNVNKKTREGDVAVLSLKGAKKIDFKVNLINLVPTPSEIVYAVGHLQYILSYLTANSKHTVKTLLKKQLDLDRKFLKEKTLLIDEADVREKITEEEVKKIYTFPIKITNTTEIDDIIINRTKGYAILKIIPVEIGGGNIKAHIIVDTEDSKFYYFDYVRVQTINNIKIGKSVNQLSIKDFKNINKEVKNSK